MKLTLYVTTTSGWQPLQNVCRRRTGTRWPRSSTPGSQVQIKKPSPAATHVLRLQPLVLYKWASSTAYKRQIYIGIYAAFVRTDMLLPSSLGLLLRTSMLTPLSVTKRWRQSGSAVSVDDHVFILNDIPMNATQVFPVLWWKTCWSRRSNGFIPKRRSRHYAMAILISW